MSTGSLYIKFRGALYKKADPEDGLPPEDLTREEQIDLLLNNRSAWNSWVRSINTSPQLQGMDASPEALRRRFEKPGKGMWMDVGANFEHLDFSGADLTDANLRDAYLFGTDLREATLTGADLTGAHYDQSTRFPIGFDPKSAGMRFVKNPHIF